MSLKKDEEKMSTNLLKKIDAAIASEPGGFEAELMAKKNYRRDLWDSYGPGKYDDWATAYLDEFVGNGMADEDIGDAQTTNAYSLVKAPFLHPSLAKKAGAILEYDSQGFVRSEFFTSTKALNKKWKEIEEFIEESLSGNEDD